MMTHIRLSKVILALALVMTILCGNLSLDGWQGIRFTPAPAKAEAVSDNLTDDSGWQYRLLTDGNAQITGYSDAAATALTVPLSLGGLWVTSIAGGSFTTLEQLQSLTIPASVTDIATNALSGLSDVKIRAYNGSAALAFASLTGLPAQCLSEYEFFSDVLDLSDMRSAQFTFQGNGVRIASPFSQLISVGQKLFLPASRQYQNGFACQVTSLTEGSAYVLAQVAELGIMDAVEHYRAEDVQLTPDVGGVIILEEGFSVNQGGGSSFGQTAPRGWGGSATLSGSVSFDVNIKFNKNVSIVGNIKYTPNYTASIEFDWFKLQEISYSAISTFSYSLGLKCEGDPEKKSTNKPITFAAIPLTSTGLLSAWAECSMTINSSGTVIVTSSITTTETVTWKVGHRIETTKSKSVTPLHISAAIEASITYGASVLLRVGFGKCKTDIAKIGASIGYTFELQHATNALFCIDVSSKVTFSVKLQLGIIEDTRDTRSLVFNAELFKVDFIFPPLHWEASLSRFVDKCQANIIPVVFCFSSDPNTFIRNSASIHSTLQQPPAPTREGYTFTGWYKTSDCVDLWDFEWDFVPNCDELLLYAGWTLNGTDPIAPTPTPTTTGDPTPTPAPTATVDPTLPFEPEGVGSTGTYEGLTYAKYVNGIIITDCETGVTSVSIPAWIDGVPVKAIADQAFFDCSRLTSVIIPNGVTSIGDAAFYGCASFTSITIPNSVTSIGEYAFMSCASLTSITISNSVTNIGFYTFYGCANLTSITIPNGVTSIENYAFYGCTNLTSITIPNSVTSIGYITFYGCASLTSITIPNGVTSIDNSAFSGCVSLTSITIPNSVTSIRLNAFSNCTSLTSITIPNSVTYIEDGAFSNCTSLASITIPNSVTSIGEGAFSNCASLTSIIIPNSVASIRELTFSGCASIISITIPNSVTSIWNGAFSNCASLTSIIIPNSMTCIGEGAFSNCIRLKALFTTQGSEAATFFANNHPSITIEYLDKGYLLNFNTQGGSTIPTVAVPTSTLIPAPESPTRKNYTFTGWYTTAACVIPWNFDTGTMPSDALTLYAGWTYTPEDFVYEPEGNGICITSYDGDATDLVIPSTLDGKTVVALGSEAIGEGVTTITLPTSISRVDGNAFRFASRLISIITSTAADAAYNATDGVLYTKDGKTFVCYPAAKAGTAFSVPSSVTTLAPYAFANAVKLTELTLPASVTTLSNSAIYGCNALAKITFAADPASMGSGLFSQCGNENARLNLYGPTGTTQLSAYADERNLNYNLYSIQYVLDGEAVFTTRTRAGTLLSEPPAPESGAFSLAGWSLSQNGTLWQYATQTMPAHGITLYGVWKANYSYEPMDGGIRLLKYIGSEKTIPVPSVMENLPVLAIADDAFAGLIDFALDGDKGSVGEAFAHTHGYAFTPYTYSLTFEANGGKLVAPRRLAATAAITQPITTRTHYTLQGWYTDADFTTAWNFSSTMPANDLTLYARWKCEDTSIADIPFTWVNVTGGIAITAYTGASTSVTIPSAINGDSVVAIAAFAFANDTTVLALTLPESITSIGKSAFEGSRLGSITMNGVTSIEKSAFANCYELSSVTLPGSLASLGAYAFADCGLLSVSVPNGVATLSEGVFSGCSFLQSITLPGTLTTVDAYALANCMRLANVSLGANVNEIDLSTFRGCSSLASITMASSNPYYQTVDGVLLTKDGATLLCYPEGKRDTAYTTPSSVTWMAAEAMCNCRIQELTISASVIGLDENALQGSLYLQSASFAKGSQITTVGAGVFLGCNLLTNLTIPNSVTFIGKDAMPTVISFALSGVRNGTAHLWALQNAIRFVSTSGKDVPVENITLPENLRLAVDDTQPLQATLMPTNTTERGITWESSKPAVAVVDAYGMVAARSVGFTRITATAANGSIATCNLTVSQTTTLATSLTLNATEIRMNVGEIAPLLVYVTPINAIDRALTYQNANPSIVTLKDGQILALAAGMSSIIVRTEGGLTAVCRVIVGDFDMPSTMLLPLSLAAIHKEAFMGTSFTAIECPYGMITIGARAFADSNVTVLVLPNTITSIADDALEGCKGVTIYCNRGSVAEAFAKKNGFAVVLTD